jgi:hypothetical protein
MENTTIFAVAVRYLQGTGSKHQYEEVHLLLSENADRAIAHLREKKRGTGAYAKDGNDIEGFEFEAEEVAMETLEKGESQCIFGHYHN